MPDLNPLHFFQDNVSPEQLNAINHTLAVTLKFTQIIAVLLIFTLGLIWIASLRVSKGEHRALMFQILKYSILLFCIFRFFAPFLFSMLLGNPIVLPASASVETFLLTIVQILQISLLFVVLPSLKTIGFVYKKRYQIYGIDEFERRSRVTDKLSLLTFCATFFLFVFYPLISFV